MEKRAMERRWSAWSSPGSLREIEAEPAESPPVPQAEVGNEQEKVYVAVQKEIKEWRANFAWVLRNTSRGKTLVVVHVHRPAQRIPTALGWFHASQLQEEEVGSYRKTERENMNKCLDEYVNMCLLVKIVKVEKLVIEKDDVGKGLLELISLHRITKLVMGATANRNYSRRMNAPKSKTAITVQQQADPSCNIWFICKGNLICMREACPAGSTIPKSPLVSLNSTSSPSEMSRSRSLPQAPTDPANLSRITASQKSKSVNHAAFTDLKMAYLPDEQVGRSPISGTGQSSVNDHSGAITRDSDHSVFDAPVMLKNVYEDDVSPSTNGTQEDHPFQSPQHELDIPISKEPSQYQEEKHYEVMYEKLKAALTEAENSKLEAYDEFHKRQKAEKDLNEAMRREKITASLYIKEVKLRQEAEETLAKEKMELSALEQQRDEVYMELKKAQQRVAGLQLQISNSEQTLKDIKGKLSEAYAHLSAIRQEHEALRQERDIAIRENKELRQKNGDASTSSSGTETMSQFSLSELEQATENFNDSLKIGEGGYGRVYKGNLRHKTVAIKRLDPEGMQGNAEFLREIEILGELRHPNLVTLVGACPEAMALVYEFLPNGSLEDKLACAENTIVLTWQARIRVAAEICSALVFLHSRKPLSIVHGDLKPANILLDANLVGKLGDFGICRLLIQSIDSTTLYHCTRQPRGTFAYMAPELLSSGEITTKADVYSFGIILLRLLTRRPAFGINRVVQDALDTRSLDKILDASGGDWPYVMAEKLAKLGLMCCEINRRNRPEAKDALKMLEPLVKSATAEMLSSSSFRSIPQDSSQTPPYFLCPIFKEIMKDPQIAADGFTYEAEAIKGWLDGGRETSPMTNARLSHHELIPNFALRSAIQGWLQQQVDTV